MQTRTVEGEDDMIVTTFVPAEEKKKQEEVKAVTEGVKNMAVAAEDEEEDMQPVVHDAPAEEQDDGFKVEEAKLTETLIVFAKNQFLLYDFKKNASWQVGDVEGQININDAASAVMVDPETHRTNQFMAIISGGSQHGIASDSVFGLVFDQIQQNAVDSFICSVNQVLPQMGAQRYFHQSAIIKGRNNRWCLLVAGGKSESKSWLNSVEVLDLSPYFRPG